MKIKHHIITVAVIALAAFTQTAQAGGLPAPMPEFMNQEQVTKWQADRIAKAQAKKSVETVAKQGNSAVFYTGKPYLEETGSYAFRFRNYDPELNRWTTLDPSGFPNGANPSIYSPVPTTSFDWQGLNTISIVGQTFDIGSFTTSVASFKADVPGSQWTNSTNNPLEVTYSITGGFQVNATVLDTGVKLPFSSSTSATASIDPGWKSKLIVEFSVNISNVMPLSFVGWEVEAFE